MKSSRRPRSIPYKLSLLKELCPYRRHDIVGDTCDYIKYKRTFKDVSKCNEFPISDELALKSDVRCPELHKDVHNKKPVHYRFKYFKWEKHRWLKGNFVWNHNAAPNSKN